MDAVITRLARSPRLGMIVREIDAFWETERRERQTFYDGIEDGTKTEFINGETIMHSPDRAAHFTTRKNLTKLLDTHVVMNGLGFVGDEKVLICLTRNDYMPDVVFFGPEKAARITKEQMQFPAPHFIAEVLSPSTRKRDRGVKFEDYAAHGVAEYWLLDPAAETVEIFHLSPLGHYLAAGKASGEQDVRSSAIKGFKVPARAFFDDSANLAALKKLLR